MYTLMPLKIHDQNFTHMKDHIMKRKNNTKIFGLYILQHVIIQRDFYATPVKIRRIILMVSEKEITLGQEDGEK